ncbi:putative DNA-binding transcriptional regulator AlpA [Bradyrhizobium sp. LB7.1]
MGKVSLREFSLPRFALRRDEAAASLAISPTLFDDWVNDGRMPKGRKIGGVVLWDAEEVRDHWITLRDADASTKNNPFDQVIA